MKWRWEKAYLRTISDEIAGESVRCEPRAEPLRTDGRKACLCFWQAACWLETINRPTGTARDSLDDTVLCPKMLVLHGLEEKNIYVQRLKISLHPLCLPEKRMAPAGAPTQQAWVLQRRHLILCASSVHPYTVRLLKIAYTT